MKLHTSTQEMIIQYMPYWPQPIVSSSSRHLSMWGLRLTQFLGKQIIDAGWGQRHGFSGTSAMTYLSFGTLPDLPAEYILIYAPRSEAEIDVVMEMIAASVKFMSGRENVR